MLLKFNDNKNNLIFAIACFFLVILISFIQLNNIYADVLIENNPFDKFDKENLPVGYEYIGYNDSNNMPTIFAMSALVALREENSGCVVSGVEVNYLIYKYNNSSWDLYLQSNTLTTYEPIDIDIYLNNIKFSSFDLHYISSTNVVFQKTPLGIVQEVPTIRGGMSAKAITQLVLNWMVYLAPLVLGLVVSVVAFRKAWIMLRTLLVGA